jgi:hypothetical protein
VKLTTHLHLVPRSKNANTPSWLGAQLKRKENFTFLLYVLTAVLETMFHTHTKQPEELFLHIPISGQNDNMRG